MVAVSLGLIDLVASLARRSLLLEPTDLLSVFVLSAALLTGLGLLLIPAVNRVLAVAHRVLQTTLFSRFTGADIWRVALAVFASMATFLTGFSLASLVGIAVLAPGGFSLSQPGFLGLVALSGIVFIGLVAWRSLPTKIAVALWLLSLTGLMVDVLWLIYGSSRHGLAVELVHGTAMLALFVQAILTGWRISGIHGPERVELRQAVVSSLVGVTLLAGATGLLAFQSNERIKVFFHERTAIHYRILSPFQPLVRPPLEIDCDPIPAVERSTVNKPIPEHRGVVVVLIDSLRYDVVMESFNGFEPAPELRKFVRESARPLRLYATHPSTGATMAALTESSASAGLLKALRQADVQTVAVASHQFVAKPLGPSDVVDTSAFENEPDPRFSLTSEAVTQQASAHLETLTSEDDPFLLFVHYYDPHGYYVANDLFDFGYGSKARYAEEVAYTNHWVSRFLSRIPSNEPIATMLLSDHGDEFWDHGALHHGLRTYDESSRLVFGLQSPEIEAVEWPEARSVSAVPRTLLELLGATEHAEAFDPSLFERIDDTPVIIEARHEIAAADRFGKVILNSRTGSMEYYDFADDPEELNNLMPEALESERVRRLTCSALDASRSTR